MMLAKKQTGVYRPRVVRLSEGAARRCLGNWSDPSAAVLLFLSGFSKARLYRRSLRSRGQIRDPRPPLPGPGALLSHARTVQDARSDRRRGPETPGGGWPPFLGVSARVPTCSLRFNRCTQPRPQMKPRSSSADAAVKALLDAAKGPPTVPAHVRLRKEDLPFWDGVIRARAREEWTDVDLVVAAQLARCQCDIESESLKLDLEGAVIATVRGTLMANPRGFALDQMARREMALMRTLRMGGRVAGDSRNEVGRRRIQRQAEKARQQLAGDDLLAS